VALAGGTATASAAPPGQGPGGPILVVTDPGDPFGRYYAEILAAEGLNAFDVRDVGQVSQATLEASSVVVLAARAPSAAQVEMLSSWVVGGGNLVAMRPTAALAGLLGLGSDTGDLDNGYIQADTGSGPGAGITAQAMQFHDRADRWTLAGATRQAELLATAATPTGHPAVTLRSVGSAGGQAAAFTYDLARSVVQTRQGNPAWAGQKRDGQPGPIRSDDLFFPDWVDLGRVALPQADEQQRLLANLITQMSIDRLPIPRLWYFPRGEQALVVLTGDDHTANGTVEHFSRFLGLSPAGCSVADWGCVRSTAYIYDNSNMSDATIAAYRTQGFEVTPHLTTNCENYTAASLQLAWEQQLASFGARWPSLGSPRTNRTHCVAWSDWSSQPKVERTFGVRLDTNYYYWPPQWVQDRPGMFTGSGIPMRFADLDGSPIDVYQAATQLTDEAGITIPSHITSLLDGALGPNGYYGAFTVNMHTDQIFSPDNAATVVAAAQARGVPVISAAQLLDWLDGRNNSSFGGLGYDGSHLRFSLNQAPGARGLEAMVPAATPGGRLASLTRDGAPVTTSSRTVKGIEYRVFAAAPGAYVATYPPAPAGAAGARRRGRAQGPRVRVRPHRVRVSRRGRVKLRVTCPRGERVCRVDLRLRRRAATLASAKLRVSGGKTRAVRLALKRRTLRRLARAGSMRVLATSAARDSDGNRAATKRRLLLLAPAP
jgi:hypothetical protein